jgi:hypothetical protein
MPTDAGKATWRRSFDEIRQAVANDRDWSLALGSPGAALPAFGIHLAVFIDPYLGYVLDGSKTVESRFSSTRCAPYGKVMRGDLLMLKRAGGPVVGIARACGVWSYRLNDSSWKSIREQFTEALRAQAPEFWDLRSGATFATLMSLDRVLAVKPVEWEKRDRRGWVVVRDARQPSLFRGLDDI